ncbi:AlpA family phage regulatory protein [Methylomicrobium sp. Wu6]|uniref:helix-turn-helix transcriptional regulator n=1 Tax=Methylomicrobium sp. Wu6 TaxID=3107928 RepID=UPI002DD62AB8|nr:AlpA family phage regulatory protein [Methylomicrobium sp. Wu6]MEC4747962.1 AlpA family phage regulatory protein [Methylomicrobium sp. Wu6]
MTKKSTHPALTAKPNTPKTRKRKTYVATGLPSEGFVRLPTFARSLGISENSVYNGIKAGKYPPGILLTPRTRVWDVAEIRALIEKIKRGEV